MRMLALVGALAAALVMAATATSEDPSDLPRTPAFTGHPVGIEVDAFRQVDGDRRECPNLVWDTRPIGKGCRFEAAGDGRFGIVTPFGEGTLTLTLERLGSRWRLRADRAMIGQSGLSIRGEWSLDDPALELVVDDDGGVPREPGLREELRSPTDG